MASNHNLKGIGFGTWAWGNKLIWGYDPEKNDPALREAFKSSVKAGLSLVDTADSYGTGKLNGRSETLIGEYVSSLSQHHREKITIATKLAPFPWRLGRNGLKKAFLASKRRLRGNLDLLQLHWSTARYAPMQENLLLDGLGDLVESGDVKSIGLSNLGPKRLQYISKKLGVRGIKIHSLQVQFSLLCPLPKERPNILDICEELGIELISYSPLALGILTIPPGEEGRNLSFIRSKLFQNLIPKTIELRTLLESISKERGVSQAQCAINWCRSHNTFPIPGIRSSMQAIDIGSALKWELSSEEIKDLDIASEKCQARMPNNPFQSN